MSNPKSALALLLSLSLLGGCMQENDEKDAVVDAPAPANPPASPTPALPAQAYNLAWVQLQAVPGTFKLGGTVIPRTEVVLKAQMPGRVVYIAGEPGTLLEKEQVVVGLDDEDLLAKRRAAWAQLAQAMSQLQNAHLQLTRQIYGGNGPAPGGMGIPSMFDKFFTGPMSNMMGFGNSSLDRYADVNQQKTGVEQAQAAVVQAQAAIDELDARLRDKVALAPGKSVLMEKMVEVGDIVQPGMPLARVADANDLQVRVQVPTRYIQSLSQGMMIPVEFDSHLQLKTMLEQIYPSANPESHTITVKLAIPPGAPVAPGMYAEVQLPDYAQQQAPMPVIPTTAVVWRGGQPSAFVVDTQGKVQLRMLRLGDSMGDTVTVLSGLWPGERYLVTPPPMMRSGMSLPADARQAQPSAPTPPVVPAAPAASMAWPSPANTPAS